MPLPPYQKLPPPPYQQMPQPQCIYQQGNHGNQATVNVNVIVPEPTAVVIKGRCTGCGGVLEDNINICSAILVAILFFPFGLLCCLFMTERKCSRCGALYS